ncbi:MAG: lactate utilization protein [Spirochaetes bacterium]|nr:lactate utilization protein [Spirochaetota bacterium]
MTLENNKKHQILLESAKKAFERKGFEVHVADTAKEAVDLLVKMIGRESVIGFGGSRTLEQIGFHDVFTKDRYPNLLDRNDRNLSAEERRDMQKKSLTADFFLCSANSISIDGNIFLIDYNGNRNAGATYGPDKRIFVAGWNKLCLSLEEAGKRASDTASVLNNIRFNTENPCTKTGYCVRCNSEKKLCNVTTIISGCTPADPAIVLLIKEDLGF